MRRRIPNSGIPTEFPGTVRFRELLGRWASNPASGGGLIIGAETVSKYLSVSLIVSLLVVSAVAVGQPVAGDQPGVKPNLRVLTPPVVADNVRDGVDQPKVDPKATLASVTASLGNAKVVFVATVTEVNQIARTNSVPPSVIMTVALKNPEMLKGDKPEVLTFGYSAVQGRGFFPQADQKVVVVLSPQPVRRGGPLPGPVMMQPGAVPGNKGGNTRIKLVPGELPVEPVEPGGAMQSPAELDRHPLPIQQIQPIEPGPVRRPIIVRPVAPIGGGAIAGIGRILAMCEATDENVAAVKKAIADIPTSRPATQPAGQRGKAIPLPDERGGTVVRPLPPAGQWASLFEGEGWYKSVKAAEREFSGVLSAVPHDGAATTLQRTGYYQLGNRMVYTGAKKVGALDSLTGKRVIIRGKPYDLDLEGRRVSEIWPGAVRIDDSKVDSVPATPEPINPLPGLD